AGVLAWADRIVCSPASVNMVSEACATRVPVHVFDPSRVSGRPRRFLDSLLARGRIRAMDTALEPFAVEPPRETARVAAIVRERLALSPKGTSFGASPKGTSFGASPKGTSFGA